MSVWNYMHTTPYIAAKSTMLLSSDELYELAERNINFMITKLMDTPYRKEINTIYNQRMESVSLEDALLNHFTNSVLNTVNFAPKNIVSLVKKYTEKFEVDALKNLIKVIDAKISPSDAYKYIIPSGRFSKSRCEEILAKASTISDLTGFLMDTDYSYVIYKNQELGKETELAFLIESDLTKNYYEELWRTAKKVGGLDGRIIREIVGLEITSKNIKVMLRYLATGYKKESISKYLIIIPEILNEETLNKAIQSSTIEELIMAMKTNTDHLSYDYHYMLNAVHDEYNNSQSISRLEYTIDKSILVSSQLMVKRHTPYFNTASLIAYINAKWYEFRNIRAILHGISTGLPANQIKGELFII